jgi:hypothetical protein
MSQDFKTEVLTMLRENGSDTALPHEFEYFVYVPKKLFADMAATKMRESGWTVTVVRSDGEWLCTAKKTLTPEKANLTDQARFFTEIAAVVDGRFDGWAAAVA